jgi:glycosyltransferase involved in cell wall biosynthesis
MPSVSIVVSAFNVGPYIRAAVDSVRRQTFTDTEIIVIDDGSTDDTSERLRAVHDVRLRVVRQPNAGLSAARNAGIALASGRYIGFLDGDDVWHPDKLKHHVAILDAHPEIGLTFSRSAIIDASGRATGRFSRRAEGPICRRALLIENIVSNGSSAVLRRDVFTAVGGFDTALTACEDHDMWLRVTGLRDGNAWAIPEALTGYRIRAGQMSRNVDRMRSQWEAVIAKAARQAADEVEAVRGESTARFLRYLAYLSYESGRPAESAGLFRAALQSNLTSLLADRRSWVLAMALLAHFMLPRGVRRPLEAVVRRIRPQLPTGVIGASGW